MKVFATAAALASLAPGILSLTMNTPTGVVACEPLLISWTGGEPPYYVTVMSGGQVTGAALKTFDTQSGNQLTWIVDLAGGISITLVAKDSTGAQAFSDMVTIQTGTATSCNVSSAGTSSAMSTTPASGAGAITSSKASGSGTGSATAVLGTTTTSKSTASQASSSSKASHDTASSYLAALMGLLAFL